MLNFVSAKARKQLSWPLRGRVILEILVMLESESEQSLLILSGERDSLTLEPELVCRKLQGAFITLSQKVADVSLHIFPGTWNGKWQVKVKCKKGFVKKQQGGLRVVISVPHTPMDSMRLDSSNSGVYPVCVKSMDVHDTYCTVILAMHSFYLFCSELTDTHFETSFSYSALLRDW